VSVQYLDLTDYLAIACEVTGLELATVVKIADVGLADFALHASTFAVSRHRKPEDPEDPDIGLFRVFWFLGSSGFRSQHPELRPTWLRPPDRGGSTRLVANGASPSM
jgi:hypothetical protein